MEGKQARHVPYRIQRVGEDLAPAQPENNALRGGDRQNCKLSSDLATHAMGGLFQLKAPKYAKLTSRRADGTPERRFY